MNLVLDDLVDFEPSLDLTMQGVRIYRSISLSSRKAHSALHWLLWVLNTLRPHWTRLRSEAQIDHLIKEMNDDH